jgi:anti-sigma factor RsiW
LLIAFVGLQNHLESSALKERVLAEVAMNHRKQLDVEFVADQYLQLQQELDRLDFSIVPKGSALTRNYRLVGGRYCSIQGQLAAQLKVEDKMSGEWLTLYIAPLNDELQRLSSSDQTHSGVYIRLWQEDERFFALASTE